VDSWTTKATPPYLSKTNTNFNPASNFIDSLMLHILAKIRMQPNVMHGQRHEPHTLGDFVAVYSRIRLNHKQSCANYSDRGE
jgi:hypothetical protein